MRRLQVLDLGTESYGTVLAFQRELAAARISGEIENDLLVLVEHPPVVTLGRTSKQKHLVASAELLAARGVELFEVERGGDVTFHGPGQLVGYPIFDLKHHKQDLHWYLRQVEEAIIRAVAEFGIAAERRPSYTGVWTRALDAAYPLATSTDDRPPATGDWRKLASIGVHARDWVTWHGFALNVTTDLSYFDLIVPCGIPDVVMTSIGRERPGADVRRSDVVAAVTTAFADVFGFELAAEGIHVVSSP